MAKNTRILFFCMALVSAQMSVAGSLDVIPKLVPGTKLTADQINIPFQNIREQINDNDLRITNVGLQLFEAELKVSANTIAGEVAADLTASNGSVRVGLAASNTNGRLWGIYARDLGVPTFSSGFTTISARFKVTNNTLVDVIGRFNCAAIRAGTDTWSPAGTTVSISPNMFAIGGEWQNFTLNCDFRPDDVSQFFGVDNFVAGLTDLSIDYFRLEPVIDNIVTATCVPAWSQTILPTANPNLVLCSVDVVTPWPALLETNLVGHMRSTTGDRCSAAISIDDDLTPQNLCCTTTQSKYGVILTHSTQWVPVSTMRFKAVEPGVHRISVFLNNAAIATNTCNLNGVSIWVKGSRR